MFENFSILFIDTEYSGISGDLLLSSLADIIGIDVMENYLNKIINELSPSQSIQITFKQKLSNNITGVHFSMNIEGNTNKIEHHFEVLNHNHHVNHQHNHSHFTVDMLEKNLKKALNIGNINDLGKEVGVSIFNNIVEAESKIHNIPINEVHLHEIGSFDTIIDISGCIFGLNQLGLFKKDNRTQLYYSPISVGGGTVKCAHGILPVPAPVTSLLLKKGNLAFNHGPVDFELATPTGVSILTALKKFNLLNEGAPNFSYSLKDIGTGIGSYTLPNRPNILQLYYGIISQKLKHQNNWKQKLKEYSEYLKPIYVLETNVDDVRGEILGNLIENLVKNKALDVSIISTVTKKNRPGNLISIICNKNDILNLIKILFKEIGTLGIRIHEQNRICLPRKIIKKTLKIMNKEVTFNIKITKDPYGNIIQKKIEFNDLKRIGDLNGESIRNIEILIKKELNNIDKK